MFAEARGPKRAATKGGNRAAILPVIAATARSGLRIAAKAAILPVIAATAAMTMACATSPSQKALATEWYGVGNAWMAAGKYAEAGKAYDRALTLDPGLIAASYNAARALVEAGSYDRALPIIKKLLAGDPQNLRYVSLDAWALWKSGKAAEAAAAYEAAFVLDPWAEDVVYNSALLLLDSGKPADIDKAVARLDPLVKARPDDKEDLALYARALALSGRDEDAIAAWEDLRSMGGADAPALLDLAGLYEKRGEDAKALDVLDEATKKDAQSAKAWFALARLRLTTANDGTGGLDALGKAIAAGFKDRDAAAALLASSGIASRDEVAKALAAAGLVDSGGTGVGAGDTGSASLPGPQDAAGSDSAVPDAAK
ncbi:MAG TPA: tetratricopeptide repeat protein [Rectinemataceae bacterium]|nr:tetratricopeptide repeat protein [Rectinemataceae bacterium]